jgi:glycerate 2-kinase
MNIDSVREAQSREMRDTAREIFNYALAQASVANAFSCHVHYERGVLRVCEDLYDLHSYARVAVISIGKAGHTMAEALTQRIGEPSPESSLTGIVATSVGPTAQIRGLRYFLGGHPTPNAESVSAGSAILRMLDAQTAASLVIFLLSGGGSSIVEKPIDDEISLGDLVETYRALVHSGAPIGEINAIRKHLSAIKGGRLARAAFPAQQVSMLVSDVPDATPDALASGPTMPDSTSAEDCYRIAEKHGLLAQLPPSARELFERHALEETPKSDDPAFSRSRWWMLLSNGKVLEHARIAAGKAGFTVHEDNSCDDWDYAAAAEHLLRKLRELRERYPRVCLLSGGEVTVKVTNGGTGGRNQQFALACATMIDGENITALSAGTDGVDGNSPASGAVADGTTLARARTSGLDAASALASFNAYPFFKSLGDSVETGPTGNNLRDLRILLAY